MAPEVELSRPADGLCKIGFAGRMALARWQSNCVLVLPDLPARLGLAPEVGFEPTTNRLTADRSTAELLRIRQQSEKSRVLRCCQGGDKIRFPPASEDGSIVVTALISRKCDIPTREARVGGNFEIRLILRRKNRDTFHGKGFR